MEHAGERAPFPLLKGDVLRIGSIPGLRGSGYYAWRWWVRGESRVLIGWLKGSTSKGHPRRVADAHSWGLSAAETAHDVFRVVEVKRPL